MIPAAGATMSLNERSPKNLFTILMLDIARMQKSDLRAVPRAVIVGDGAKKILSKRYQSRTV
jgi:hypothetical protein